MSPPRRQSVVHHGSGVEGVEIIVLDYGVEVKQGVKDREIFLRSLADIVCL